MSASHAAVNRPAAHASPPTTTPMVPLPTVIPRTTSAHVELATAPEACADGLGTSSPLARLRSAMKNTSYTQQNAFFGAFVVFYTDEHLSEDPSPFERRLQYISGWDGAGAGAVLAEGGAALWVPAGDVRRARETVTCAWLVIDADDPRQPTIAQWIGERLGRSGRVGGDARLASMDEWQDLSADLQRRGLQLVHIPTLVDQLWNDEMDPELKRPEFSKIVANLHNAEYTGVSWRDKVTMIRAELRAVGVDAMVVTALDEVAWLLNVRGRDLPHAPLLKAFVVVSLQDVRVYAPPGKLSMPVREVLAVYNCYTTNVNCTKVNDYTAIYTDLRRSNEWMKILIPAPGTFQRGASAAIAQSVPPAKRQVQLSPIIYLKAQKNMDEAKGMRRAHLRDAVAMCTLLSYLEGMVKKGLDELSVATKVDITRATQAGYVGVSMKTRAAFGPNGADPDYLATNMTRRRIFTNSTLVIRSGGQYDEGTTVVTRTVHYGIPSREERKAYTTVLRSLAALASLQTPALLPAAHVDPVARAPLWASKQDYPYPTGHGVGAALNRREDPVVIDYRQDTNLHTLKEGYFITAEPAWYEAGKFGVRLGNIVEVVPKPREYLGFQEATMLPFEPKLIDRSMLTEYEINWLNSYNTRIRTTVGPELSSQGLMDVFYWMMNKTVHVESPARMRKNINSGQPEVYPLGVAVVFIIACSLIFS
ncbi:unnamed protein product [Plutella xylostella]|uniref:(diamondback moth) hypothetical protein n=1 Tax=Plutella xylostella TaxID=51655 RepID=A0A8S4G9P5_PLUXY|nr:unnamed protein product [Plutella xylostella]